MSAEAAGLDTPSWISAVLERFEASQYFDETDVANQISVAAKKVELPAPDEKKAGDAEWWAFCFLLHPDGTESGGKIHFGPIFVSGEFRNPDIAWIDEVVLVYWERRKVEARHPLLRARYADLVWDLSKLTARPKAPIEAARIAVDGYVAASRLADAASLIPATERLRRALRIALGTGDTVRAEQVRDAMAELVARVNEKWGLVTLYDTFEEQTKIKLTPEQLDAVIAGLERRVMELAGTSEGVEPLAAFPVSARLVRHYQSLVRQTEADRVVRICGQAVERRAARADHTLGYFWLDQVYQYYRINSLDEDAQRVQLEARRRGELARHEAIETVEEVKAPSDQVEKFLDEVTDGGLNNAIKTIVGQFLPNPDEIRELLNMLRREHPLGTMWPITKMSEGQMVARIGPVDTDPEGALINGVADNIRGNRLLLEKSFDRLRSRYTVTPNHLMDFIYQAPLFTERFRGIIMQGVEAYFAGDHQKVISLLVPQIENALRFMLQLVGRPPNKPRRGNQPGMTEKTLTDILEYEPVVKDVIGEAMHTYLFAFLADARGFNIRNKMCHGLMVEEDFNRWISDRVLHIFLLLGSFRRTRKPSELPTSDLKQGSLQI
jgi:hypothetical protein